VIGLVYPDSLARQCASLPDDATKFEAFFLVSGACCPGCKVSRHSTLSFNRRGYMNEAEPGSLWKGLTTSNRFSQLGIQTSRHATLSLRRQSGITSRARTGRLHAAKVHQRGPHQSDHAFIYTIVAEPMSLRAFDCLLTHIWKSLAAMLPDASKETATARSRGRFYRPPLYPCVCLTNEHMESLVEALRALHGAPRRAKRQRKSEQRQPIK